MIKYHFSQNEIDKCEEFGRRIAWKHPHFKDSRNTETRTFNQVKGDVTRGKLAEIAVHSILTKNLDMADISPIDFNVYPKGVADQGDIVCNDLTISIKSSKPIASCLLIETARFSYDDNNTPIQIDNQPLPDYFTFVKIDEEKREAIICGISSFEHFWNNKTFLPRGMVINYVNAQKAMLDKIPVNELPSSKGVPLLADNFGLHIKQLQPFEPTLFKPKPMEQLELIF